MYPYVSLYVGSSLPKDHSIVMSLYCNPLAKLLTELYTIIYWHKECGIATAHDPGELTQNLLALTVNHTTKNMVGVIATARM